MQQHLQLLAREGLAAPATTGAVETGACVATAFAATGEREIAVCTCGMLGCTLFYPGWVTARRVDVIGWALVDH